VLELLFASLGNKISKSSLTDSTVTTKLSVSNLDFALAFTFTVTVPC
jgi:hypothetical protein